MIRSNLVFAAAGALGLSAAMAFAQQGTPTAVQDPPVEAAATGAAESEAEPRSDAEVLEAHRAAHFARVEARRRANQATESQFEPRPEIRYHPAW